MTEAAMRDADQAFGKMVAGQLAKANAELNRLEQLMKAGQVDARIVSEFRSAVERVRASGWQVQAWLGGDERALSVLLMEERIRLTARLASQLALDIAASARELAGLGDLRDSIDKLGSALAAQEVISAG
jgi:hypothetical protein